MSGAARAQCIHQEAVAQAAANKAAKPDLSAEIGANRVAHDQMMQDAKSQSAVNKARNDAAKAARLGDHK